MLNQRYSLYSPQEVIAWSWEFLTVDMKLPADRLYVTYFEGHEASGLEPGKTTFINFQTHRYWLTMTMLLQILKPKSFGIQWASPTRGFCPEI